MNESESGMQSPGELELSRRGLLAAGAASVAVTAVHADAGTQITQATAPPPSATVSFEVNGKRRTLELDT